MSIEIPSFPIGFKKSANRFNARAFIVRRGAFGPGFKTVCLYRKLAVVILAKQGHNSSLEGVPEFSESVLSEGKIQQKRLVLTLPWLWPRPG